MDAYDHIGKNTKSRAAFDNEARQPFINAGNGPDAEPKTDPGYMAQISSDQQPVHWADGGGIYGSEKLDAYGHIGKNTKGAEKFADGASQPFINAGNGPDKAPVTGPDYRWAQKQWYTSPNGGSELEDVDHDKGYYQGTLKKSLAQKQWYTSPNGGSELEDVDHDKGYYQGTLKKSLAQKQWYTSPNGGSELEDVDHDKGYYQGTLKKSLAQVSENPDQEYYQALYPPTTYSLSQNKEEPDTEYYQALYPPKTAAMQLEWYTDGNGAGSEKGDLIREHELRAKNSADFYNRVATGLTIPSDNKHDT